MTTVKDYTLTSLIVLSFYLHILYHCSHIIILSSLGKSYGGQIMLFIRFSTFTGTEPVRPASKCGQMNIYG